jgi:hypothetical protein
VRTRQKEYYYRPLAGVRLRKKKRKFFFSFRTGWVAASFCIFVFEKKKKKQARKQVGGKIQSKKQSQ